MQIKKNDNVLVISGKERGKRGKVMAVYPTTNRLVIEKLNMIKRHTRPNQQLKQGGIVEKEAPISASKVKLICSKCDKPTKITRKAGDDGSEVFLCQFRPKIIHD